MQALIFTAAKHPKSFVSLDDADHLLTRRADAVYVADMLAAWAGRYLAELGNRRYSIAVRPRKSLRVAETGAGAFQQEVLAAGHRLLPTSRQIWEGLAQGRLPTIFWPRPWARAPR
jgi:hypothetical protein